MLSVFGFFCGYLQHLRVLCVLLHTVYCSLSCQLLVLGSQSLLHSLGYYRIILFTFYAEAALAAIMLVLGPQHYYFLAFFLTVNM